MQWELHLHLIMPITLIKFFGTAMGIRQPLSYVTKKLHNSDQLPEPPRQSQMGQTALDPVCSWISQQWRGRGTG